MGCDCNKKPAVAVPAPTPVKYDRLSINCFCGISRLIPTGLKVNDTFDLVPCPKCGTPFRGVFVEGGVYEVKP
jgi:hypothetical protein